MILTVLEPVEHGATFYHTFDNLIRLSTFSKILSPQKIEKREFKLNVQKIIYSHQDF